ncbi:transglutaminaseTgpA domain-containing protein [Kitasatospora sp. NPDC058965]|uniref:transglutaminase family protein n=1 Tax=Kitasatospora sp. NPDC058965 TaxID=3346682 RepID=UPI0036A39431
MTTRARLTLYSALASALAMLGLSPLLRPEGWLLPTLGQVAVVALVGAALRRFGTPRPLVPAGQLVVALYLLVLGSVGPSMTFGVLPLRPALHDFAALLTGAPNDIANYAIPAPATPSLRLLLIGSVALVAVLVDALAVTYRRAALAGLPLLALYSVGTGLAGSQTGALWLWFLCTGGGYLMLLFAEGRDRLSRWGRVFRGTGATETGGGLSTGGHLTGILTLVGALLIGGIVPAWDGLDLVNGGGFGNGGTGGSGHGSINALNPVVSLADGLRRPENQVVIRYHGTDPALRTAYLRTTALDDFNGTDWQPGNQPANSVPDPIPAPEGLDKSVSAAPMTTDVSISDSLSSQWLPVPYPLQKAELKGDWRYEPESGSLIGAKSQKSNGMRYTVTSLDVGPTADQLRQAPAAPGPVLQKYTQLPANLPGVVRTTAQQVTDGAATDYDKAMALQTWFTVTGNFVYSPSVDPGTGPQAIAKFLQDKRGFCVHFAATFAAMARSLGIPARVAVGFAPGDDLGGGNYQVGTKDYHAWPELYFSGVGWTRFEPTPSRGVAPAYGAPAPVTTPTSTAQQPTATPTGGDTAAPSAGASCAPQLRRQGGCPDQNLATPDLVRSTDRGLPVQLIVALAVTGAVLLLAATPMLWRRRLRRRRLGEGRRRPGGPGGGGLTEAQVLAAWQELIDTAWDLGIPPDESLSPRNTVARINEAGQLGERGRAAAGRVALATERALYARDPGPSTPLGPDVRTARESLRAAAGRRRRLRAELLPPSTARVFWRVGDAVRSRRERAAASAGRLRERLIAPLRRSKG